MHPESTEVRLCRGCGARKPLADFPANAIARGSRCKLCTAAQRRAWRAADPAATQARRRREYAANAEQRRASAKRWREQHPDLVRAQARRWYANNHDQAIALAKRWQAAHQTRTAISMWASQIVRRAVARGDLVKPSACEMCGTTEKRIEGAHIDYRRPLDVRWLCRPCHVRWDRAEPKSI